MQATTHRNGWPGPDSRLAGGPALALSGLLLAAVCAVIPALPPPAAAADGEVAEAEVLDEVPVGPEDRQHWAYRPLVPPPLPSPAGSGEIRNAIDLFILARLHDQGLAPVPEAARGTLLRRLTLTLTGLPPTPEEREQFLADSAPDAYEQWVERLLASPRFGARWGQFWLDLARFAETDGYEFDKIRPHAWQYRDWVIHAANRDLTYDDFVRQQVAGDELWGADSPEAIATAFCLSGPDMPDINSQEERRHSLLNELTGTMGAVFLATQIGCAQCHEHRFDPVSQADFFRLRAFFESAVHVERDRSIHVLHSGGERERVTTHLAIRGDWRRPGPAIQPGFPRMADWETSSADLTGDAGSRAALAAWLVHPHNPLTARVIANRAWQFHFGRGLCATSSDFGLAGDDPTHPELLDYLATELLASGWSLKHLHRQILLSSTFRRQSHHDPDSPLAAGADKPSGRNAWQRQIAADPRNRWYGRFPRQRLEGEFIRDSMLSVVGVLDERMGGPGVRPPLPEELRSTLLRGQWDVTEEVGAHYRRSIYVFARRNLRFPIFEVFDRPDPNQSCPRRHTSTTAPQSLLLLNSHFSWEMAERLAARAWPGWEDVEQGVRRAMLLAWGREALEAEVAEALAFLRDAPETADSSRVRTQLCLAILNSSEFLYID